MRLKNKDYRLIDGLAPVLFVLLIAFLGCNPSSSDGKNSKGDDETCDPSQQSGYRMITHSSGTREYILHIPSSYDDSNPTALVINFHGYGGCITEYAETIGVFYNLNSIADNENFIIAYPQAVLREKGDRYWEPGDDGTTDIQENDAYFTKQLIEDIDEDYNVDLTRVYATGYSNGGMMAYELACTGSDFIAAAGIMSGAMLADACNASEYTSIIIFHGIADGVLPYQGNQDYRSVDDVVNIWINHNDIPSSSKVTTQLNGGDVVRDEYIGGQENTSVVLYTINEEKNEPGGHVWFSGEIDGNTPNKILWDFLSSFSL